MSRITIIAVLLLAAVQFTGCIGSREKTGTVAPGGENAMMRPEDGNGEDTAAGAPPPGVEPGMYKKPVAVQLKKSLTLLQYTVTQEDNTEAPYNNEYWDNHKPGIYADIVSGEPLFSSLDKFDSGTGWPSFTKPLEPGNIVSITDTGYGMVRTEVRSRYADSHLGHVFGDGPPPTGLRYCINSASLRFIPAEDLEKEGYGKYANNFQ